MLNSDVRDYNVLQSSIAVSCLIQLDVDTRTEEYVNDTWALGRRKTRLFHHDESTSLDEGRHGYFTTMNQLICLNYNIQP